MDVFITESAKGSHHRNLPFRAKIVSLQGSNGVKVNEKTKRYQVSRNLVEGLRSLNPRYTFIGTDLDVQGTKVGTLIRNALGGGDRVIRYALTENGYVRVGEFMDDKRLSKMLESELENVETARAMKAKFGKKIGKKSAIVLGAVAQMKESGQKSVKVLRKGTSTITALVKGRLAGSSYDGIKGRLDLLYGSEKIAYPRVDNDYVLEKPYDLYPHPSLTSRGYADEFISPIEEEELELNGDTVLLELSNRRLITPSMAVAYGKMIDMYFEKDLTPKKEERKLVEECVKIYEESREDYVRGLEEAYHPQLVLSPPVPPPPEPGSPRKKEEEWEEMIREALERARREQEEALSQRRRTSLRR